MTEDKPESRVQEIRLARGLLNQVDVARAADNMDPSTFNKIDKGKRGVSPQFARQIAIALDVPQEALHAPVGSPIPEPSRSQSVATTADLPALASRSDMPRYLPIPTLEVRAGAGGGGIIDGAHLGAPQFFEETFITRDLRASPEDLVVVEVEGQSMQPVLCSGDTVLVDRRKQNIGMEGIFVLFDGDYVVCKIVERVRDSDPAKLRIRSANDEFKPYEVEADRC